MVLNPDSCQQRSSSDAERGLDSHERRPSGLMAALRGSQGAGYSVVPAVEGETGSMGNDIPLDPSSSGAHPQWVPISDLDAFFTSMYQYYDEKGFACVVAARLTRLLNTAFATAITAFALGFVDWQRLAECADESACRDPREYVISWDRQEITPWRLLVIAYAGAFAAYCLLLLLRGLRDISKAWDMRKFYRQRLNLATRDIQTMDWEGVVRRVAQLQASGAILHVGRRYLNAHDIASRIMRRDNYIVGMLAQGTVLNLELPPPFHLIFPGRRLMTSHLETLLRVGVLNHVFTDSFSLRTSFANSPSRLRWRLRALAIVDLALMPVLLLYHVAHFVFQHADTVTGRRLDILRRRWTHYALWRFREYNELPHYFRRRMSASYKPASEYERQFDSPLLTILARSVSFLCGATIALMLPLYALDERILLHVVFFDRTLLWYMSVLAAVLAATRSMIPAPENELREPTQCMKEVIAHTHYHPQRWRRRGYGSLDVREEFLGLYPYIIESFFSEMLAIAFTPLALFFTLPRCADRIIDYVRDNTTTVEGVGDVLSFSRFDLVAAATSADMAQVPPEEGAPLPAGDNASRGLEKVQQSLLSFIARHPTWDVDEEGKRFLNRFSRYAHRWRRRARQEKGAGGAGVGAGAGAAGSMGELHEVDEEGVSDDNGESGDESGGEDEEAKQELVDSLTSSEEQLASVDGRWPASTGTSAGGSPTHRGPPPDPDSSFVFVLSGYNERRGRRGRRQ